MKLIITERWVLKKIAQRRYFPAHKDKKETAAEAARLLTYRKVRGVERSALNDYLINELDPITKWKHRLYFVLKYLNKIDATKGGRLIISVNDIIDQALNNGYLYPLNHCGDEDFERLKLTKKGYGYISPFYWGRAFFGNEYVKQIINTLIQWGIPLIAVYLLSKFFNITIVPKL